MRRPASRPAVSGAPLLLLVLSAVLSLLLGIAAPSAVAREGTPPGGVVVDRAGALNPAEEAQVERALGWAGYETGRPMYALTVPGGGWRVESGGWEKRAIERSLREELLREEAKRAGAPDGAGLVLVAPDHGWAVASSNLDDPAGTQRAMQEALDREDWDGALQRAASHVVFGDDPAGSEPSGPEGDRAAVLPLGLAVLAVGLVALMRESYKAGLNAANRRSRRARAKSS